MYLYIRNQALFANMTLHTFWQYRKVKLVKIPDYVFHALVMCAGGFYYYSLLYLNAVFNN